MPTPNSLFLLHLHRRHLSQSTSFPKKLQRVRDHSFDAIMETAKKIRRALALQSLLVPPSSSLPLSRLSRPPHLLPPSLFPNSSSSSLFLLRHPHVFHLFLHPVHRLLYFRLTPSALRQLNHESLALSSHLESAVLRLRKLLLLASPSRRLRLDHLRVARRDLGLPEDFEQTVVLSNPRFFRLVAGDDGSDDPRDRYVEFVEPDNRKHEVEQLCTCAIEIAREREYRSRGGKDAEDLKFGFLVNFPPGFKIGKYYRIAVWKWQRLPYWSPYEDVSGYDLRSLEAQRRMEKRAVAMVHEFLSLTVEKRTTLERIAQFRQALGLPKKLKDFLLQHQGIFYVSTRGNQGKLHTVFLREAYRKGELVEENELYLARRKLGELLLMSPKKANVDRMLTSLGRGSDGHHVLGRRTKKELVELQNGKESDDDDGSGSDSGVESQFVE